MRGKWIIADLDGTLLNSRQRIGDSTVRRIELFRQNGGDITIATGRTLISAKPYIEQLKITMPVILFNGAKIYDPLQKVYWEEHFLPLPYTEMIMNLYSMTSVRFGLDLLVFVNERIFTPEMTDRISQISLKDGVHVEQLPYTSICGDWKRINKMMFLGGHQQIEQFRNYCKRVFLDLEPGELNSVISEPGMLEVLPPGINKGTACRRLLEMTEGTEERLVTVGDGLNDMEMVSAFHGIAMNNAHPDLKKSASWVTLRNNDEDALLEVIDAIEQTKRVEP
ncbi:HAD family hydrolase [Paenibacillus sp. GYB004]|uniref:HAD family hydrolase n=1 Tax=Paenibacillus sp. GYB004 TaxID=2994393 RepID=UPI002F962E81